MSCHILVSICLFWMLLMSIFIRMYVLTLINACNAVLGNQVGLEQHFEVSLMVYFAGHLLTSLFSHILMSFCQFGIWGALNIMFYQHLISDINQCEQWSVWGEDWAQAVLWSLSFGLFCCIIFAILLLLYCSELLSIWGALDVNF